MILAQCAGVNRKSALSGQYFRAVSSAGNRHPYEVYVSARGISGLADAVWHYDPRSHALTSIGPTPIGDGAALVVAGVPWRSCWRYSERGYRHVGWDCGTVASHAVLAAAARGLPARLETAFDDAEVRDLIGARDHEEIPMVVVPLTGSPPALTPASAATPGDLRQGMRPEKFPLVLAVHEAGNLRGLAEVAGWRQRTAGEGPLVGGSHWLPDEHDNAAFDVVVNRRTSARRFDATSPISQDAARWILDIASAAPPWDAGTLSAVTGVVHNAVGMAPGVYRQGADGLARTMPTSREATHRTCLDQLPGRDAAMVLFVTPSPGPGVASDARAYRASLLAGGFALGRIYLAATVLRLGCSGLTFVDSSLPGTIGAPQALAVAAVGKRVPSAGSSGQG